MNALETNPLERNPWQALPVQPLEPLWPEGESVTFSPSGLATYATCPRQFYYSHWLKLKSPSSWASVKGSWIHWLLERLSQQTWRQDADSVTRLSDLASRCLSLDSVASSEPTPPELQAFLEQSTLSSAIQAATKLQRQRLLAWTLASVQKLDEAGLFERARVARSWQSEVSLQPRPWLSENLKTQDSAARATECQFQGTADVIAQDHHGQWILLDYKSFGPSRLSQKNLEKRLETLALVFTPPEAALSSHRERFPLNLTQPRLYQLPIYYHLASQQPPVQTEISSQAAHLVVGIQLVRPDPDAATLMLHNQTLTEQTPPLLTSLYHTVAQPLQQSILPEAVAEKSTCAACGVRRVCPDGL